MSDNLLLGLLPASPQTVVADKAAAYCQNYPALNRAEAWRWMPLSVLRGETRTPDCADFQSDSDAAITEDFAPDASLTRLLDDSDAPFAAIGLALCNDTLIYTVPAGCKVATPIAINVDALGKKWQFSSIAMHLDAGAEATFWLDVASERDAVQLPSLFITLAEDARLEGVLWQSAKDASKTAQLIYVHSEQAARSALRINGVQSGSPLSRLDIHADLNGTAAIFDFGGIQLLDDENAGDFHVIVRHNAEQGLSRQVVRGALNGHSQALFDGTIYVAHGAQQTDGKQNSRFILLSEHAKAQGIPRLEIYADDVQCAHGTTVGFLDPEMIFYLRSRGISLEKARSMLLLSFLEQAVMLEEPELKKALEESIQRVWEEDDA